MYHTNNIPALLKVISNFSYNQSTVSPENSITCQAWDCHCVTRFTWVLCVITKLLLFVPCHVVNNDRGLPDLWWETKMGITGTGVIVHNERPGVCWWIQCAQHSSLGGSPTSELSKLKTSHSDDLPRTVLAHSTVSTSSVVPCNWFSITWYLLF